jgi:sugar phosphate isomerase/epimerase
MVEGLGLVSAVFQPFRDFEGMPEPKRAKVFSRAERKFDVMQELGCDFLMVCSNVSPDSLGTLRLRHPLEVPEGLEDSANEAKALDHMAHVRRRSV